MTEMILKAAKNNSFQVWNKEEDRFDKLRGKDFVTSSKSNGVTTLQIAIMKKNLEIVKLLTKYGADINKQD